MTESQQRLSSLLRKKEEVVRDRILLQEQLDDMGKDVLEQKLSLAELQLLLDEANKENPRNFGMGGYSRCGLSSRYSSASPTGKGGFLSSVGLGCVAEVACAAGQCFQMAFSADESPLKPQSRSALKPIKGNKGF
mmetsp:Transcript_5756/g.10959  ORF Transcript_5756/g.10959 Transcript_5756/m.10959 type:complete len:135 (+) Transcript_5756:17-421(+)